MKTCMGPSRTGRRLVPLFESGFCGDFNGNFAASESILLRRANSIACSKISGATGTGFFDWVAGISQGLREFSREELECPSALSCCVVLRREEIQNVEKYRSDDDGRRGSRFQYCGRRSC